MTVPTIALEVNETLAGQRIDRVVSLVLEVSRSVANELIDSGQVRIDRNEVGKPSIKVELGQVIELPEFVVPSTLEPDPSVDLDLVHSDDHVIVINKDAGLVVHPGAGVDSGTLAQGIIARFPEVAGVGETGRPGIVHRLDKGTSGLLMVARTESAYLSLTDQLRRRTVGREYWALVHGQPASNEGVIDAPIGRSLRHPTRQTVRADGKAARTSYEVLERFGSSDDPASIALLQFVLETGRTHQIRVHADAIGHPLVGDDRYGSRTSSDDSADRPMLHARYLGFEHPGTGDWIDFSAEVPDDFETVLIGLRSSAHSE